MKSHIIVVENATRENFLNSVNINTILMLIINSEDILNIIKFYSLKLFLR